MSSDVNAEHSPSPGGVVSLAQALIRAPSITPEDRGCQGVLVERLKALGFTIHTLPFGPVLNFYARLGRGGRNFCFAGHTDVVPPGDGTQWRVDPFGGEVRDGELVGRGACDMKGALAAMVAAVAGFLARHPDFPQRDSLSFLITGDEEGDAVDGTVRVLEWLAERGEGLDYCLVGEPTCGVQLGDCIKNGRRGSVNGVITIPGVQGHVAYPHLADNPIHKGLAALDAVARLHLDDGNAHFAPSSLQFTAIHSGGNATNVIPGELTARFNIRFNTRHTPDALELLLRETLSRFGVAYRLRMSVSGLPFLTDGGELLAALGRSVARVTGVTPEHSTGGGTSDARFISRVCPQTIEFGLVGGSMHKVNEAAPVADLEQLAAIYEALLEELLGG